MISRSACILFCILLIGNVYGFVKRDVSQSPRPNLLEPLKRNVNQFRECLDRSLAGALDSVHVEQLQPIFDALGYQLNRFSKAFDVLTSPKSTPEK